MTQYNPQYPPPPPGYSMPPMAPTPPMMPPHRPPDFGARRFPFVAGYILWFMPALWRDAGRRWGGIGFWYITILVFISWAIPLATHYASFASFIHNDVPKFAKEVPAIDIKDGVVTTDVPYEPYIIKNPDTGSALVVIDTTGETTEPPKPAPSVLLTRNSMIVRQDYKVETHDLSQVKQFHMDKRDVQSWADKGLTLYWPVFFPGLSMLSLFMRIVQMLVLAAIGMAIASGVRPPLTYAALMRLSALAMTPVILLDILLWVTGLNAVPCVWFILGTVVQIVLLVFMIRANNEPGASPPPGPYFAAPVAYPPQPPPQY